MTAVVTSPILISADFLCSRRGALCAFVWSEFKFSVCLSHLSLLCHLLFLVALISHKFLSDMMELVFMDPKSSLEFLGRLSNINTTFRDHASHFLKIYTVCTFLAVAITSFIYLQKMESCLI